MSPLLAASPQAADSASIDAIEAHAFLTNTSDIKKKIVEVRARIPALIDRVKNGAPQTSLGVKSVVMHDDGEKMKHDLGDDDNSTIKNPLQFKPNLDALLAMPNDLGDNESQSKEASSGVYKPPRVAPMRYDDSAHSHKGRLSQQIKEKASKSRLLGDLQTELMIDLKRWMPKGQAMEHAEGR
ncbi:hypothetical protein BASA83_002810 [Batrachochytrium salamandrivorans]|nr:hypothetical protein BASA83_002810 [Batrachochytrium salamandrivorans]